MTQPEATRPRPDAELHKTNSEEESRLVRLGKLGGAAFMAAGLAIGGLFAGETQTTRSEKKVIAQPIEFGNSSLHVVDVKFKDGRELTNDKSGNGTVRFPNGNEYAHHKDDPIKFGVSELQVVPPKFTKSNLRVASSSSSNAERKED